MFSNIVVNVNNIGGKRNRYFTLIGILLLIFPTILASQTIKGLVVDDSTHRALGLVNIQLRKTADSSFVTGAATDTSGNFELSHITDGEYFIEASLVGYQVKKLPPVTLDQQNSEVNVGTISLVQTAVNMEEVVVESEQPLMSTAIDKKIYNVDQDIMSKSVSASDVLRNIPSVEVDIDGEVSLRGSSDVLIMIDGKTSLLMDKNRAEALQQIPASTIKKIEVMTNPTAKYKPDAASGIINIILKKGGSSGLNGGLTLNAGKDDRYNGGVRLNYKEGGLSLFGSYSPKQDTRNRTNTDTRMQVDSASTTTYYNQNVVSSSKPMSHLVVLGGDLTMDKSNRLGLTANYYRKGSTTLELSNTILQNADRAITSDYDRNRIVYEVEPDYSIKTNYQHNFSENDKLRIELKDAQDWDRQESYSSNRYQFPLSIPDQYDNLIVTEVEKERELSADYSNSITDQSQLEAGYDGEFNNDNNEFYSEYFDTLRQSFRTDVLKTNHFIFNETIHAFYTTFEQTIGLFGFKAGLRAEQVFTNSDLVTNKTEFSNDYFSLYPTLHLQYKFNDAAEVQLNYSRRTHRPHGSDVNPFIDYSDPRNLSAGNPFLSPEYIHSMELGGEFQNDLLTFLPTLYYRYEYNRFTSVTQVLNDSTLLTTSQNLSNAQSAGLELVVSAAVSDLMSGNASINVFRDQIDASNLGLGNNKSIVTWKGGLTCNFTLAQSTRLQVNSNYHSSKLTAQGTTVPSYSVNLGMRQDLMDNRLTIVLTASDLFKTRKKETDLYTPTLNQTSVRLRDSRVFYLGVTFNFGVLSKKSKDESLGYDEDE